MPSFWIRRRDELLRAFLEADTRGLAVFRIAFGLVLLGYLYTRCSGDSLVAFQTDLGVYPAHYALFHPGMPQRWSFLFSVTSPAHVKLMMAGFALVFACYTIGYRTRLFSILTLLCLVSLHHRVWLITNASMVTMHVLCIWSLALPLGRHYSVDAWLARQRGELLPLPGERVRSLAVLAFRLQLGVIYFFNVVHKTGETWTDGTAVHYVLWQDRIAQWPAVLLREHGPRWFSAAGTYGTLVIESAIAVCVLFPFFTKHARRLGALLMVLFHGGLGILVNLGPFPVVFPCAAILLMSSGDWSGFPAFLRERVLRGRLEPLRRYVLGDDEPSEAAARSTPVVEARKKLQRIAPFLREAWVIYFLVAIGIVVRHDNPFMREHFGDIEMPEFAHTTAGALYVPQGWALFAPHAPKYDGLFVVDAHLADGTHVDPLRHAPPDFDIMDHGPFGTDYFWQTYVPQLVGQNDPRLWDFFVDYLGRIPEIEEWEGERRITFIAVYYVGGERQSLDGDGPPPTITMYAARGTPPPGWMPAGPPAGQPAAQPVAAPVQGVPVP